MNQQYIKRDLEDVLRKYLNSPEIIIVIGPRQSGKSTLLNRIFSTLPSARQISFEDIDLLTLFENDVKGFYQLHVKGYRYVFIDEVQYARAFGKNMKYLYDTTQGEVKFFVTGSSITDFYVSGLPYLVGRAFTFHLYPFSFREFLRSKNERLIAMVNRAALQPEIQKLLNEFIIYGGYPRVVLSNDPEEKKTVLKNLYNLLIQREITSLEKLLDQQKVVNFVRLLAVHAGNMINYTTLAKEGAVNINEVKRLLSLFSRTFVTQELPPFFRNKKLEIIKNPKIYFIDNGLRNAILNNFSEVRPDSGVLHESFVFQELLKQDVKLRYWRTKMKAEVDFVVESDGQVIPVEVKMRDATITRSFRSFIERYHPEVGLIFNLAEQGESIINSTRVFKKFPGEIIRFQELVKPVG